MAGDEPGQKCPGFSAFWGCRWGHILSVRGHPGLVPGPTVPRALGEHAVRHGGPRDEPGVTKMGEVSRYESKGVAGSPCGPEDPGISPGGRMDG